MQDLNLTLIQARLAWEDKAANLAHFADIIRKLEGPTDVIVLPEMFSTGFSVHPAPLAEEMEGPTVEWIRGIARETGAAVVTSFIYHEKGQYFNRLVWMMPAGNCMFYDKRHLFRLAGEHHRFSAGIQHLVVEYKGWRFRPLVCYDLRFPVWSRNRYLAGIYDYDILVYVANWPNIRSHAWKSLLLARAIENLSFVAAVNRVGADGNGIDHSGDSAVIDPSGRIIAAAEPGADTIIKATLSWESLRAFREKFDFGPDADHFTIS